MEKHSTALIEQLQSVHARQRKAIQQLQAESARLLSDLAEVRRERDAFREDAARLRKEQAELQNKLDEAQSEYRDLKRERIIPLSRAFSNGSSTGRLLKMNNKVNLNGLSALTEGGAQSPSLDYSTERTHNSQKSYSSRELPQPRALIANELRPDEPARRIRKQPTSPAHIQRSSISYGLDASC